MALKLNKETLSNLSAQDSSLVGGAGRPTTTIVVTVTATVVLSLTVCTKHKHKHTRHCD